MSIPSPLLFLICLTAPALSIMPKAVAEPARGTVMKESPTERIPSGSSWANISRTLPPSAMSQIQALSNVWDREISLNRFIRILEATPFRQGEPSPLMIFPVNEGRYDTWRTSTVEGNGLFLSACIPPSRTVAFFKSYMDQGTYKILVISGKAYRTNRQWILQRAKNVRIYEFAHSPQPKPYWRRPRP